MSFSNRVMKSKTHETRQQTHCPIFRNPSQLPQNTLPTYHDVMKFYLYTRRSYGKTAPANEIFSAVSKEIEALWQKASIPTVSHNRCVQMLRNFYEKYRNLMKLHNSKDAAAFSRKKQTFLEESCKLFDIASCKCLELSSCKCSKERKVSLSEQNFLVDQRSNRVMYIGSVDVVATDKLKKRSERKEAEEARIAKMSLEATASVPQVVEDENFGSSFESEQSDSTPVKMSTPMSKSIKCSDQTRIPLPTLSMTCDRYGISDRAGAAIATSVLKDVGFIVECESSGVIDRSKLRRERKRKRDALTESTERRVLHGLYFDGRKDQTLTNEMKGSTYRRKNKLEEHYSIVGEPGSYYVGHVSPASGSAKAIETAISNYLEKQEISLEDCVVVGCDGTATNTGINGGVIRLLEEKLSRPLHWIICLLHVNELPLRHLFIHLDGTTSGPNAFSGPIGKSLKTAEALPVVNFREVQSSMTDTDYSDISTDQKYLYELTKAVMDGDCSESLSLRDPGKLCHSRWLTTANRILRLYVSTENPSKELQILAEFIVKVYAPMWFSIKNNPLFSSGSLHIWKLVKLTRYLPEELRAIVDPVIQRNAYFAHQENMLIAMITDENMSVRKLGYNKILKARLEKRETGNIRKFIIPQLNFQASSYVDMISWQSIKITEPPVTMQFEQRVIEECANSTEPPIFSALKFPCHNQAVERCVKLVTDASNSVCGQEQRDGFIRSTLQSRKILPVFNTKADFFSEQINN